MRILSFLVTGLISVVLACGQAAAQGYKPDPDTSAVTSYESYTSLVAESYKLYQARSDGLYVKSKNEIERHFVEYSEIRLAALMELRSADRASYLEWLDAREMGEHAKVLSLEITVPSLALFKQRDTRAFETYSAKKRDINWNWSEKSVDMFKVYQEEKRLLWIAYQALPK